MSHFNFSTHLRLRRLGATKPTYFEDAVHMEYLKRFLPSRKTVFQRIHRHRINSLTLHPVDPHLILSASANVIALWNIDLESIAKVDGYIQPLFKIRGAISSDARASGTFVSAPTILSLHWFRKDPGVFFSGDSYGRLKVWDTSSATEATQLDFNRPIHQIDSNPLTPTYLGLAMGQNSQLPIIDINVEHIVQNLSGHTKEIRSLVWNSFGRDKVGWDICTGSLDGTVRLWDLRMSRSIRALDPTKGRAGVYGVNLTTDGQYLIVNTSKSTDTWHLPSSQMILSVPFTPSRKGVVLPIPLPSSNMLFPSFLDGSFFLDSMLYSYFTLDSDQVQIYLQSYLEDGWTYQTLQGSLSPITSITYSPFTMQLFTGSDDGSMVCFDATRSLYQTLHKKNRKIVWQD